MATRTELAAAYAATTYRVDLPDGPCDLRLGQVSPRLSAWLQGAGFAEGVIVTAHNPASCRLEEGENALRQAALESALRQAGARLLPASNRPDDPVWPVERACLVLAIGIERPCTFARDYGQNAVVVARAGGTAELLWLE